MRGNLLTAAIALVLLCSLAGCNDDPTAGRYDTYNKEGVESGSSSALERNGVHDGRDTLTRNGQGIGGYWDGDSYTDRDAVDNTTIPGTMGENAMNGIGDTGRNIANGVENATRDAVDNVENAARDAKNALTNRSAG